MERSAYTIRIFVANGDPEGIRVVDQMNWTGTGIAFPRTLWTTVRTRKEFDRAAVYILVGYNEQDDELPRIYIGEGDGVRDRIDSHDQKKDFWTWGICFTSNADALNKAHVQWLEYALVQRATEAGPCTLDNVNIPRAPGLSEHEEADVTDFLERMLRILPVVNLRAFQRVKPVAIPAPSTAPPPPASVVRLVDDTIIVPAQKEGFERVFLGEQAWHAVRIAGSRLDKIKYCAAYQSAPVSAVTHVAPVRQIEPFGDSGKYRLVFAALAEAVGPIPFADAPPGTMQSPRFTTYARLKSARKVADLF